MTKEQALEIISEIVESYIDISHGYLTSSERARVLELIGDVEALICD
jgi:hypothetical protein